MTRIVFIEHDGNEHHIEAEDGQTLMQVAVDNLVPGIVGDCGGSCSCATCHAYIGNEWLTYLPPRGEDENMMLEGVLEPRDNSRLACQVNICAELDGMVVELPERQY